MRDRASDRSRHTLDRACIVLPFEILEQLLDFLPQNYPRDSPVPIGLLSQRIGELIERLLRITRTDGRGLG